MMPMQVDRRKVENQIHSFLDLLTSQDEVNYFNKKMFAEVDKCIHFRTRRWENLDRSVLFLRDSQFFDRMVKMGVKPPFFFEMLPHLEVMEKNLGDIIFCDYKHAYIVINGRVSLRFHK